MRYPSMIHNRNMNPSVRSYPDIIQLIFLSSSPSCDDSHTVLHCMPRNNNVRSYRPSAILPFLPLPLCLITSTELIMILAPLPEFYAIVRIESVPKLHHDSYTITSMVARYPRLVNRFFYNAYFSFSIVVIVSTILYNSSGRFRPVSRISIS